MLAHERELTVTPGLFDRPRERLYARGAGSLSDRDLLAVLLGSGSAGHDVFGLAGRVLDTLERSDYRASAAELTRIAGVGPAKAALVAAALEFARRVIAPGHYRIRHPSDAVPLLAHYADRRQEHFLAMSLNGAHEVIATRVISVGLVNRTLVHPREVFAGAIGDRAAAIICAHNHPSGNVEPSSDDRAVTRTLAEAGDVLGVRLLDHIIFSPTAFWSFLDHGEV